MTQKTDGGPAYPCKVYTQSGHPNGESMGMSLRDWFAGQASEDDIDNHRGFYICTLSNELTARYSREQAKYIYADAMIAARGE